MRVCLVSKSVKQIFIECIDGNLSRHKMVFKTEALKYIRIYIITTMHVINAGTEEGSGLE